MGVVIFKVKLEMDISANGLRSFGPSGSPSEMKDTQQLITLQHIRNVQD